LIGNLAQARRGSKTLQKCLDEVFKMLGDQPVIAMIATAQPERAKTFYSDLLGLKLVEDQWFALVYMAGGTRLHIQKVKEFSALPFTAIGWTVPDIATTVAALAQKGIKFERFRRNEAGRRRHLDDP
jgi:catechol 2,3-dioxygenase-like lactoylglutathione lyase family enzyme